MSRKGKGNVEGQKKRYREREQYRRIRKALEEGKRPVVDRIYPATIATINSCGMPFNEITCRCRGEALFFAIHGRMPLNSDEYQTHLKQMHNRRSKQYYHKNKACVGKTKETERDQEFFNHLARGLGVG